MLAVLCALTGRSVAKMLTFPDVPVPVPVDDEVSFEVVDDRREEMVVDVPDFGRDCDCDCDSDEDGDLD